MYVLNINRLYHISDNTTPPSTGTMYKYESNRGPQYRELKYDRHFNKTSYKPEHVNLYVNSGQYPTVNPSVVISTNSVDDRYDFLVISYNTMIVLNV